MKKFIMAVLLVLVIFVIVILRKPNKNDAKVNNDLRYIEIRESSKDAVEWSIRARYPNCDISST